MWSISISLILLHLHLSLSLSPIGLVTFNSFFTTHNSHIILHSIPWVESSCLDGVKIIIMKIFFNFYSDWSFRVCEFLIGNFLFLVSTHHRNPSMFTRCWMWERLENLFWWERNSFFIFRAHKKSSSCDNFCLIIDNSPPFTSTNKLPTILSFSSCPLFIMMNAVPDCSSNLNVGSFPFADSEDVSLKLSWEIFLAFLIKVLVWI